MYVWMLTCVCVCIRAGMGCGTVLYPEAAAQTAATMLGVSDHVIWAKLLAKQLNLWVGLKLADRDMAADNH